MNTTDYTTQAETFLKKHGIKFRATLSDSKSPFWAGPSGHHYRITLSKGKPCTPAYTGNVCSSYRIAFDFWDCLAHLEAEQKNKRDLPRLQAEVPGLRNQLLTVERNPRGKDRLMAELREKLASKTEELEKAMVFVPSRPTAYDILACISSDVNCPETFKDFCGDYGCEEDSIQALQTFRRCSRFAKRLREFFTKQEQEELSEIQ